MYPKFAFITLLLLAMAIVSACGEGQSVTNSTDTGEAKAGAEQAEVVNKLWIWWLTTAQDIQ
jgi:hypothetical protein